MRRTLAAALLFLVGWNLVAPAFALAGDSQLPVCCRRDGRHHCVMMTSGDPLSPQTMQMAASRHRCPLFPAVTLAGHAAGIVPVENECLVWTDPEAVLFCGFDSDHCLTASKGHPKRGPPKSFFS